MPEPVLVYFATNRVSSAPGDWKSYGADILAPTNAGDVIYAVAKVSGTDLKVENSGQIDSIDRIATGAFSTIAQQEIVNDDRNILVFIHGFANSFEDSIKRAAFNREWFSASGVKAADTLILAFSWPSAGKVIAAPPHFLADDYLADQARAGGSAFHLASFLKSIKPLLDQAKAKGRRVTLLAHSMGVFALQGGVESWFAHEPQAQPLFDAAVLAAGDERRDSFEVAPGARLTRLKDLAPVIGIYYSERDVAMYLSVAVNMIKRLGHEGPEDFGDTTIYPRATYGAYDAAEVNDYNLLVPIDASHQYYRRSAKARASIVGLMAGAPPAELDL